MSPTSRTGVSITSGLGTAGAPFKGMDQFSEAVAERLRELKIGGNEHGHAVRTQDPVKGAFDELEFIAVTTNSGARPDAADDPRKHLGMAGTGHWRQSSCLRADTGRRSQDRQGSRDRTHLRTIEFAPHQEEGHPLLRSQFHPKKLNDEMAAWVTAAHRREPDPSRTSMAGRRPANSRSSAGRAPRRKARRAAARIRHAHEPGGNH